MAKPLVSDELWAVVQPLLPPPRAKQKPGRPRVDDRAALTGIIFVLKTGIPWEYLPQELGCGSGMTCWRRLREWQTAGVWQRLHHELLNRLGTAGKIDWRRASADSATVPAKGVKGGRPERSTSAPTPPTARNQGRNITWWATATASRWRACKRPPM
jgi:transposase